MADINPINFAVVILIKPERKKISYADNGVTKSRKPISVLKNGEK